MLALALLVLTAIAPGTALATEGRAVGWEVETATESITFGKVELRYDPALEKDALVLAKKIPGWWSEIEQELAGDLDDALTIHFVKHAGRVADASGMPEWVAGVASPKRGEIMIAAIGPDGAQTDLKSLTRHELVHVALHRATGGHKLPRWFHEGVADSVGDDINFLRAQTLASTIFGPGVPPLEDLEAQFRGDGRDASVAYAAARDFASHLRYRDPEGEDFRQLLTEIRMGTGFEASFQHTYDISLPELEAEWRKGLLGRFIWFPLMGSGGLPLLIVTPFFAYGWWRRRRKYKEGLARLEDEDRLARAAALGTWG